MVLSVSRRITTFALSLAMLGTSSGFPLWADYTINGGQSVTVDNVAGTPTSITEPGNITINGILRGREVVAPGGALTGNGGHIVLTSTGGIIAIGSAGQVNVNATLNGGNGGTLTLNGPVITVDGLLSANGLTTGAGGTINFIGDTININATANVQARGLTTSAFGGKIDINATDQVNIANGAVLSSQGKTTAGSKNYIEIDGAGVNIHGLLNATGTGTDRGGRIKVTATSAADTIDVGTTGKLVAFSSLGDGGEILLDGNIVFAGNAQVHTAADNKSGGTITITGAGNRNFTLQNGGILYANGRVSGANSHGGAISISTGSVALNQGFIKAEGAEASGAGGIINIQATTGNITTGNGSNVWTTANNGGHIALNAAALGGQINIGAGSWIRAQGDQTTTVTLNADGITVAGTVEAGGYRDGTGGTLDINVTHNGDFLLSGAGLLSSRGGESVASDGGLITIDARDIALQDQGNLRVYGTQPGNTGALGNAGRILLTATRNYSSGQDTNINARGTTAYSSGVWTDGYIGITAADNLTLDGLVQTGGREFSNGGGGGIRLQAGNTLTVLPTARMDATVTGSPGSWLGDGGDITLLSTAGSLVINGSTTVLGTVERGMMNAAGGTSSVGGNITLSAPNGGISLNGARLLASGDSLGGVVQVLAPTGLIDISGASVFQTQGGANTSQNKISIQGSDVTMAGAPTFNISSTIGRAGLIELFENGTHILGATGTFLADGTATGGELHIRAGTLTSNRAISLINSKVNLESTAGDLTVNNPVTAGDITLTANGSGRKVIVNGVTLTSAYSNGDGGNLTMLANSDIDLLGATAINAMRTVAGTNGGNVSLTASNGNLNMTNAASAIRTYGKDTSTDNKITIAANTVTVGGVLDIRGFDAGNVGGDMTVTGNNGAVAISNTILATGGSDAAGGNVTLQTLSGGGVSVSGVNTTGGTGAAGSNRSGGNITVASATGVTVNGDINSAGYGVGRGGTVTLNAQGGSLLVNSGADIYATAETTGNGGTIDLDAANAIQLSIGSNLQAQGGLGGAIQMDAAGNIDLLGTNLLHAYAVNTARLGGTIAINSTAGNFTIGNAGVQLHTYGLSSGSGNKIDITAQGISTLGALSAYNNGGGQGGVINMTANGAAGMTVGGTLGVQGNSTTGGSGGSINLLSTSTGGITLNAPTLSAAGYVRSGSPGAGGNITVSAANGTVSLAGAQLLAPGDSLGGVIQVLSPSGLIDISGNTLLQTQGLGSATQNKISLQGNDLNLAGTPTFNASSTTGRAGLIELIENGAFTLGAIGTFQIDGTATGGELKVRAGTLTDSKTLTITNSKVNLESTTGNLVVNNAITAGDIALTANNTGSGITVNAVALNSRYSNGDGGNITLAANSTINLSGNTDLYANRTLAGANGGNVSITSANGAFTMTNTGALIRSYGRDAATDNKISISARSIDIGGQLNAEGFDSGNTAGDITLTATNGTLNVSNTVDVTGGAEASGGTLTAQTNAGGGVTMATITASGGSGVAGSNRSGGTVTLTSNGGGVTMNGPITARGYGLGQGGTLRVNATGGDIGLNNGADNNLSAEATGTGGTVDIDGTGTYSQSTGSHIYVYGGRGGTIDMNTTGNLGLLGTNYLYAYATNATQLGGVIRLTSGGTLNMASSNARIYTYGQSDATNNLIELTGNTLATNGQLYANNVGGGVGGKVNLTTTGSMAVNGALRARGDSAIGGAGGAITLQSNTGAIALNSATIEAQGYVKSDSYSGNGGTVTINAAQSYYQTAGIIDVSGDRAAAVQGLNGENDGGSVSITAGTTATFERGAAQMIDTRGADYSSGSNLNGGDGGNINIAAGGNVRFIGSTNALFFDLSGGRGRSAGYRSGNGGNLIMTGGSLTLPGAGTGAANNFDVTGGASSKGSAPGVNGTATFNGVRLF